MQTFNQSGHYVTADERDLWYVSTFKHFTNKSPKVKSGKSDISLTEMHSFV